MKMLPLLSGLLLLVLSSTTTLAQWKVIALKPNSKVYVGDGLLKQGQEIEHTDKIRFTKADQYVWVHEAGKLPFVLKPGAGKKSLSNELEAQAFALRVAPKRLLVIRGKQREQYDPCVLMTPEDTKIWCSGAPVYAPSALSKPRKLLFLEQGKLYFNYKMMGFNGAVTFFYVYKLNGKRVIKPLLFENKEDYKLVKFDQSIYKVKGKAINIDQISDGAIFVKPEGERPRILSHFKPDVVAQVPSVFKQQMGAFIKILDKKVDADYQANIAKSLKIDPKSQKGVLAQVIALEKFRSMMDFTEAFFDAQPDLNSLKEWLSKNFPKLNLPKE
mgnify:FL=1